jgi:hypothetical protein
MRVRVEVSGLQEVQQALADGGKVVADKAKVVLSAAADQVISAARPLIPVDPEGGGHLQDSLRKGRPTYLKNRGTVSVAVILGGDPLIPFTRVGGRGAKGGGYNIYAVLQEYDTGRGAPFHHTHGEAHAVERPVELIAPSIPDALLEAIRSEDLGGC